MAMDFQEEIGQMDATEYKKYHESFMQNNLGSSAVHVFFCIFFTVLCSVYSSLRLGNCKSKPYLCEYIIIVLPLVLAHTIMANHIYFFNITIMTMLSYEIYRRPKNSNKTTQLNNNKKIYSISIMRGLTYLITVFAILGVDFRAFPRHLAKTERFGYSLMDTGVGLFVLMSGLVHKDLRKYSLKDIIVGNLKFITILLLLGIARYVSVKQLDYQEHVTEYGVHWNFFFTLAVCKFLSTLFLYFNIKPLLYSFIILIFHECLLYFALQDWVFSNAVRDTFISANREGISSSLGYVSLYLFAVHVKNILCEPSAPIHVRLFKFYSINVKIAQIELLSISLSLWILLYILNMFRPISRTLANMSYCLYLEAVLVTVVTFLYYLENVLQDDKYQLPVPKLIDYVNKNGLSYFLISNLLTGIINLSIRTLSVSSWTTFTILNAYMTTGLLCVIVITQMGIRI